MFDSQKIDSYFIPPKKSEKNNQSAGKVRTKTAKYIKLFLPALAALLTGLLIIIPHLKKDLRGITDDLITPRKGELEKFHMENSVFYITDYKNIVNNFNADFLDETEAGSKIIKMINPTGTLPTEQKEEVHIKAPLGFYNQNTKLLKLQDGVNLDYSAGITANTAEMFFDFNLGKAYGVRPIVTNSETAKITAQGFEYYKDKNLLIYTGKSHATIRDENIEGGL